MNGAGAVLEGPIRQTGYIVRDLDQAIGRWCALGIGPWFTIRNLEQHGQPNLLIDVASKVAHDFYNREGVEVSNARGDTWRTFGDENLGLYGGSRLNIDFTDRKDPNAANGISTGRILNTRSFLGYAWDCCGVEINYATFNLPP